MRSLWRGRGRLSSVSRLRYRSLGAWHGRSAQARRASHTQALAGIVDRCRVSQPSLSACLIVRDEATRLGACLDAVQPFVDEVVVCDTGSIDATVDVAIATGAVVVECEWERDFASARNHALSATRTDWVLSIDADELAIGMALWLPDLLEACHNELDALAVQIDNSSCPDAAAVAVHREVRLFRRTVGRWSGRVHERLVAYDTQALWTADLPAETLQLVHHGYDDRLTAAMKAVRNADLAAQQLAEDLSSTADSSAIARSALDLGRSYLGAGRPELAGESLILAQRLGDADTQHWAHHFLSRCHDTSGGAA